jgi:hypothetical protein
MCYRQIILKSGKSVTVIDRVYLAEKKRVYVFIFLNMYLCLFANNRPDREESKGQQASSCTIVTLLKPWPMGLRP